MPKKPRTDPPERLSDAERARLRKWLKRRYPQLLPMAALLWEECRAWSEKEGRQCANWEAAYRWWCINHVKFEARRKRARHPQPGDAEMPQQPGLRDDEVTPLGEILDPERLH